MGLLRFAPAGSIDLAAGTLAISAQIDRDGELVAPKTASSVRTLAAPAWLLETASRIDRLLAQPFHVAQAYTGTPGQTIPPANARSELDTAITTIFYT